MVDVYTQLYASAARFVFPPLMTANPRILYHLGTLAEGSYHLCVVEQITLHIDVFKIRTRTMLDQIRWAWW